MFQVLAYVYDSYWSGPECPALPTLHRTLNALGFDAEEILNALVWLEDLQSAAHPPALEVPLDIPGGTHLDTDRSIRILTATEQRKLGVHAWGLLTHLAALGSIPWDRMELVIDRAMASPGATVSLDDLKLIVLMVFWSLNDVPDPLTTDSLLGDGTGHPVH
jgi:Smg protein